MYKYNIKDFRQACGFTQAELAERVGCDQPMMARWENIDATSNVTISREHQQDSASIESYSKRY